MTGCCFFEPWTCQKTTNTNISRAYTYFLARPFPDTPLVSSSNAPSQQQRWLNRPVGSYHILDREKVESGPSAFITPPNHRAFLHQSCNAGKRLKAPSLCLSESLLHSKANHRTSAYLRRCVSVYPPTHRLLRAEIFPREN